MSVLHKRFGFTNGDIRAILGYEAEHLSDEQIDSLGDILYRLCYQHTTRYFNNVVTNSYGEKEGNLS